MTLPLVLPAMIAALAGTPPAWCAAGFGTEHGGTANAPSLTGMPGLLEVPAAVDATDKSSIVAFNDIRTESYPEVWLQRNAFVGFGFLPRLTLMARGSWMTNSLNDGIRDISASAQYLLSREGRFMPSLAVGAQDLGGHVSHFETRYVVASRTMLGRIRFTAGAGRHDAYALSGLFGGIEVAPCSWIVGIAENTGGRHNYGFRLAPLSGSGRIDPTFDLLQREGQGRVFSIGLRIYSGNAPRVGPRDSLVTRAAAPPPARTGRITSVTLEAALVGHGFENVRISRVGDTIAVAYENRVFNRQEWDALGVALGEMAQHADGARVMRATILRVGLPVMEVESRVDAFRTLLEDADSRGDFAKQLVVRYPDARAPLGPPANPSRFRVDLTVRPHFEPLLFTEISAAETRTSLIPAATVELAPGWALTAERAFVVRTTERFPLELAEPRSEQLLLHAARGGLPFGPSLPGLISQVSIGRFGEREVGGTLESDMVMLDGRVSVGGIAAVFGEHATDFQRSVALGSIRYRYAPLDLSTSITAGRFLHGDVGATAEVARYFGLMQVGFFAQATDLAKMAGARVAIPLTSPRDLKPGPMRVRLPDYLEQSKRTQVLHRNDIRTDVAVPLETGMDLDVVYRGRDRLNAVNLSREIESLRAAALRWVVPDA